MSDLYSDQYTKAYRGQNSSPVKDNEWGGRQRTFYFSRTTSVAAPIAIGDVVYACRVPKGSRILGGNITYGAMGASATLAVGIVGTSGKYLAATSVAAAGNTAIANTQALNFGEELLVDTDIILTAAGANFAADKDIKGYLHVSLT